MDAILNNIERDIKKLKDTTTAIVVPMTTKELISCFPTLLKKYKSVNIIYNNLQSEDITDEEKQYTSQVTIGF